MSIDSAISNPEMPNICHILDDSLGWEQRVAISQLNDRTTEDRVGQAYLAVGRYAANQLRQFLPDHQAAVQRTQAGILAGPAIRRSDRLKRADLVHAWGLESARASRVASDKPVVVELFDPNLTTRQIKLLRTLAEDARLAIVCSAETVRRRLVRGGMSPAMCVVIRPGVDFRLLNHGQRLAIREKLHIGKNDLIAIASEPATRRGGHFDALVAVHLANHALPELRIMMPGSSRETVRLARWAKLLPSPNTLIAPGSTYRFEELMAAADVFIASPKGEASTTAISWAMAAGAMIVAKANYSTCELIANKVNGLLFKVGSDERASVAIGNLLVQYGSHKKLLEVARGHAYEAFGIRRNVDQHLQLYKNLLEGNALDQGITDSAISA